MRASSDEVTLLSMLARLCTAPALGRVRLPNEKLHAVLHVVIENQIALGDEIPGLDRHEAIHCIASVLAEFIHDAGTSGVRHG